MKLQTLFISAVTALTLSACATTPKTLPSGEPATAFVIEQHKNLDVEPTTKHNLARLIKQSNNCVIDFTGNFESGKATEYWIFKGDQLISAFTNLNAEGETQQVVFDLNDPEKQDNFKSLKSNFSKKNLAKCDE